LKILVTGGNGMLGRALLDCLAPDHDVVTRDVDDMDIRDWSAVSSQILDLRPQVVIHAAAMTQVDDCETKRDDAFAVNALGSRNVAVACWKIDCPVLYVSTDYVFDGTKGEPYDEFDRPAPLSVYGQSKLAGEQWVRQHQPEHWIVRAAWSFGPGGSNFVRTIVEKGREQSRLEVVDDQVGSPTYTVDLASRLADLIETLPFGTYHLTNSGQASWYDLAAEALGAAGVETDLGRIDTGRAGRPAPRPGFSVLRNRCWELSGRPPLRDWREAVREYVSSFLL
jgi:dTDP-4-dehydrorhamnose reductase